MATKKMLFELTIDCDGNRCGECKWRAYDLFVGWGCALLSVLLEGNRRAAACVAAEEKAGAK